MKLITIVTFVAAIGAEVALASPVAQEDPPKNSLCFATPPAGLGGLTAETIPCPTTTEAKNALCFEPGVTGLDQLTAATVPCGGTGPGVVTQAPDGQVQAPVSATGNPVSLSTVAGRGEAETVGPTISPTPSISPATATGKSDSTLPAETGSSIESNTQSSTPISSTDPTFSILPIATELSSQSETDTSIPGYSFETVFTDPIVPTLTGPSTLTTHVPRPSRRCGRPSDCHPPGSPDSYPTGTYIDDWDPKVTPLSTDISSDSSHLPYPTFTYIGDWDPKVTLATVVTEDKSVEESTSVHHVGPGWSHSVAIQPLPTRKDN